MAARQAPQLRVFRNDFDTRRSASRPAALAVGSPASRATAMRLGARVTVETDRMRRTKIVQAGSGFLSQHSKELLFGLGASQRIVSLTVDWPSGGTQTFTGVSVERAGSHRRRRHARDGAVCGRARQRRPAATVAADARRRRRDLDVRAVPGARRFAAGRRRRRPGRSTRCSGKPAVVLLWSSGVAGRPRRRSTLWGAAQRR